MKKLQLALDTVTIEDAKIMIKEIYDYVDIIEIGTPLIYKYGLSAVKEMKEAFPEKTILADMKIMDAGAYETQMAIDFGADIITVLAVSHNENIKDSIEIAKANNKEILIDLIGIQKDEIKNKVEFLESVGADYICIHSGINALKEGSRPLETLCEVIKYTKKAKVSVAGGINLTTLESIVDVNPDVVIIGGAITNRSDYLLVAKKAKEMLG